MLFTHTDRRTDRPRSQFDLSLERQQCVCVYEENKNELRTEINWDWLWIFGGVGKKNGTNFLQIWLETQQTNKQLSEMMIKSWAIVTGKAEQMDWTYLDWVAVVFVVAQ